ncbi:MAG TPA: alcohol dehydrogenase catalytic domain-containing protein [Verrucomicrobiae bacterium]|jgi:NADPH:quinone reductase-like Zn-dependent oxidoreductase
MKAVQLIAHGAPGRFHHGDVPDPKPAAGEVVVRVRACGLNRLDLWVEEAGLPVEINLPRIPGGEIAGELVECGAGVKEWRTGDRVAVQSNLFCGRCEYCQRGDQSLCLKGELLGVQRDGGFAEFVTAPASALARLPGSVDFVTSAALTLAGSTAMHMLTNRAEVRPGDWVLVIGGASGVGSAAIQIACGLGGRLIATGSTEAKRELARELGAEFAVDSTTAGWPAEVRRLTDKHGIDLAVEHVGGDVLQQALHCLARGGTVVTCGATTGREVVINLWSVFVKQQRLIGSYGRNRADLLRTLDWAAKGLLKPVINSCLPLAGVEHAYHLLRRREVRGKLVIQPSV